MDRDAIQERFQIIGSSPTLYRAIDRVRQVVRTSISVLLEGESGAGKELFAQLTHELSPRRHKSLVVVNCGAIPEGLIESELFGAEKGAYTGSVERRTGYFEQADGGTIFLDEIGEMPLQAQVRLLRVLESGTFSRVGSSTQQHVDVRVVAATNKDLATEVREGRFREDLYYRLSTVVIRIPSLRERPEDIIPLFEYFQHRASQRFDAPLRRLDADVRELLVRYNWPGNVRELRNVAEQVAVLVRGPVATIEDVRPLLRGVSASMGITPLPHKDDFSANGGSRERELIYRALMELRMEVQQLREILLHRRDTPVEPSRYEDVPYTPPIRDLVPLLPPSRTSEPDYPEYIEEAPFEIENGDSDTEEVTEAAQEDQSPLILPSDHLPRMEEMELALITEALRRFDGNRRESARALGISERTLYRKLKELEDEA